MTNQKLDPNRQWEADLEDRMGKTQPSSKEQVEQAFNHAVKLLGELFAWKRRQRDDGEYYDLKFSGDTFAKVNIALADLGVAIRTYSGHEPPVDQDDDARSKEIIENLRDALRYRRLRLLGCAPANSEHLGHGLVMRFTNLDGFVDDDIRIHPERGDSPTPPPSPEWQPIETAPKEETLVLLWWPHWSRQPCIGYFDGAVWCSDCRLSADGGDPLAWMPLPKGPTATKVEAP